MKIWKAYGSSHSARLTVVGEFQNAADAQLMEQAVEDYGNAAYEERYPNLQAFLKAWTDRLPGIDVLGPTEFELGVDNEMHVDRKGTQVTVSRIRSNRIGGIIQLMLLKDPAEIKVTGRTGP
jgi:hypothetical protein